MRTNAVLVPNGFVELAESEIRLFGRLHVRLRGVDVDLTPTQQLLVAVLVLNQCSEQVEGHFNEVVTLDTLKDWFWPNPGRPRRDPKRPRKSPERIDPRDGRLERLLCDLRPKLEGVLVEAGGTVSLNLEGIVVDLVQFDAAIAAGGQEGEEGEKAYRQAEQLYRAGLLAGLSADAFSTRSSDPRRELKTRIDEEADLREGSLVEALDALAMAEAARGATPAAIRYRRRIFALRGMDETNFKKLARLLFRNQQPEEAARALEVLRRNLAEVDEEPAYETLQIFEQEATPKPQPVEAREPERTPPIQRYAGRGEVPNPPTRTRGREDDVDQVKERLLSRGLTSILGAPGIGKSRIAQEVAHQVRQAYDRPDYFELGSVSAEADVAATIAPFLVPLAEGEDRKQALARHYGHREALLVLDNCEHLLAGCQDLVTGLLDACPHLRVLVASRESLGIPGEREYRLETLSVPSEEAPGREQLERHAATRLFLDRAQDKQYELQPGDELLIARICRSCAGLPLAIELVAGWVKSRSLGFLLTRLEREATTVLYDPKRQPEHRHSSLDAAIQVSWSLLADSEQQALRVASQLPGGLHEDTAESVWNELVIGSSSGSDACSPQVVLHQLVDKSLLRCSPDRQGTVRYGMLEPIREYCGRQLCSDSKRRIGSCLLEFYRSFILTKCGGLSGPNGGDARGSVDRERENIRAVLDQADERARAPLAASVAYFRRSRDLWDVLATLGSRLFANIEQDLSSPARNEPRVVLETLHGFLTSFLGCCGDYFGVNFAREAFAPILAATSLIQASAELRDAYHYPYDDNAPELLPWLVLAGSLETRLAEFDEYIRVSRCGLDVMARHGVPAIAPALYSLADARQAEERFDEAWRCYSECVDYAVLEGDLFYMGFAIVGMSGLALSQLDGWGEREKRLIHFITRKLLVARRFWIDRQGSLSFGPLEHIGRLYLGLGRDQPANQSVPAGLASALEHYPHWTSRPALVLWLASLALVQGNPATAAHLAELGELVYPNFRELRSYSSLRLELDDLGLSSPELHLSGEQAAVVLDSLARRLVSERYTSLARAVTQALSDGKVSASGEAR